MDSRTDKRPKGSNDIFSEENLTDNVEVLDAPPKSEQKRNTNNDIFTEGNLKKKDGGSEPIQISNQSELNSEVPLPSQGSSILDGGQVFPTKNNPVPSLDRTATQQQDVVPQSNFTPNISNNFGMETANDIAKQNTSIRDNTQMALLPVLKQKNVLGEDVGGISDGEDEGVKLAKEYASNKKVLDTQHNILNSEILNTYQDKAVAQGDIPAPKLFTPIPIKEENEVVNNLETQKNEVTAKADELRNKTIVKAGQYASKINANATTAGLTTRAILGEKAAIQQSDFLDKGLPVAPSDMFYNDRQGLDALNAGVDEQYKDDLDNPEYIAKKTDIQNQYKTLIDKYPEFKRQQIAKIVAQEIMKEHPNADGMMTLPYGVEAAKKLGLSEEDIKNIDFDNLPIQSPISNAAGAVYNGIIGLGAGAARIIGSVAGVDKDVLTANLDEATRNATQRFEDVSNTQGLPTIVDADKTSPTYLQDVVNPEAGKYNYNFHTIANAIGHGMGGLAQFIGGTKVIGGIVKGALPFVDATEAGMAGLMVLQGYEPYYKQAAEVISDKPEDEWKRHAFSLINGSLDYLGFRALGKVVKEIAPEAKDELANIFKEAPSLAKVNRNALTKWTQKVVKGIEETAGETAFVGGATAGSEIAKNIVINTIGTGEAAKKANRELGSVLLTGVETLPFAIAIPVGMSKVIAGARNSFLYKENIYNAGLNPETYLGQANKLLHDGIITQDQFNQRAQVVNTAAKVVNSIPSDIELNHNQRVAYTNSKVRELALKAQKEKVDDAALEKFYDDQIKEEVAARTEILNGGSKEPPYVKPETDTKLSEPIEGLDEQGIPIGDNVPAPTDGSADAATLTEAKRQVTNLNDGETYTAYVSDINEIPEQFRDRAEKVNGEIKTRKSFLGIPYGKETVTNTFRYTFTGREAKNAANETSQTETKVPKPTEEASTTNEAIDNVSKEAEAGTIAEQVKPFIDEVKNPTYKSILKSGEESDINDVLKEVAQQANGSAQERVGAVKTFGEGIVSIAENKFPNEKSDINPTGELAKFEKQTSQPEQQPIVNSNSDAVPKEIADLYSEAANLRFTLNALDKQMGGRELAGKAKAEYDRTKARLDNVEIKLSDYEKSKENISSQSVENVKDQPKQIFEDGQVVNYYDDLFDKSESVKILYKTGDGEGGKERYQIQFENGKEASVWSDNLTKENKPTISKEQTEPTTKEVEGVSSNTFDEFKNIVKGSKSLDEAFNKVRGIKNVPEETSKAFREQYDPENNLTPKQAFEKFYNENKQPTNGRTTTEVSPTIPTEIKEPKGQGNKEAIITSKLKENDPDFDSKLEKIANEEPNTNNPIDAYNYWKSKVDDKVFNDNINYNEESDLYMNIRDKVEKELGTDKLNDIEDKFENKIKNDRASKEKKRITADYISEEIGKNKVADIEIGDPVYFKETSVNMMVEKDPKGYKVHNIIEGGNKVVKSLGDAVDLIHKEIDKKSKVGSQVMPLDELVKLLPTKKNGNKEGVQPSTESVGRPNAEAAPTVLKPKKDLGQRAREEAAKYRTGKKSVLPDFLKAKLPEGTKLSGIDINEAWAKALETFADVHDATKDFAKAIDEGFKHIKDWFDENKVPYNEKELKDGFKGEMGEPENISGKGNKPPIEGNEVEEGEEGDKIGQRRFTKQVLADEAILPKDQIAKRLDYVVRTNEMTINEATKIISDIGVDEAYDVVVGNRDVHPAVRTTMGQMLIKKFNNLASQAKDEGTKNYYWDKTIDIANFVSEKLGTEAGQSIQAFSLYSRLSPEAQLRGAIKQVKEQSASNKKKSERDVNNIGDKFKKVNEETAEAITKSKKVKDSIDSAESKRVVSAKNKIQKARERRDKIIKKYKSEKGKNLYSGVGLTKEGIEFVGDLAKTYIDEGIANLQILAEKIKENLKSVSGKDIPDDVNNHITNILKPLVEVAENTKIAKSFKELEKDIHTVIKEHYTVPEETKTTLINKFMDKVGLEESDAKELAKTVQEEFDKTATRRKEDILEKEKARFERIQNKLGGAKKVEKKTLQAEAIRFSNLGAFDNNQLLEMLSEKLGTGQLTAEQGKEIQRLAERIEKAPEGRPKNEATEDLLTYRASIKGTNWAEVAQGVWYANVLSGYLTHIKNIVSTGMNGFAFFSVEAARDPKSIPFLLYGGAKGFKRGAIEAGHTLKTGRSPIHVSKIELPNILERVEFKGGYLNPANYLKFVGRLMVGEDVLQFQGLKEMRATQLAYREAKKMGYKNPFNKKVWDVVNDRLLDTPERYKEASEQAKLEGVTGREAKRRIYELMEQSRPIKMTEDAYGFAAKGTFNHATEGTLGALTNWISKGLDMDVGGARPLRFLVPFTRIITNVANNTLDFSPIGLVRAARGTRGFEGFKKSQLFKDQYHVMTKEERQQTLAKASLGILSMAGLYALAALGKVEVTGSGPDDIKKKLQLMQGGWQDYSIKIGDKYYSYKLTPMVFAWGVIGSIRDHQNYDKGADEETILQRTALAAWDGIKNIGDMTWVNSAAPIMGALSSNNPGEAGALLGNVGRNVSKSFLIPNAYTQSAQRVQNIFNMPQKQANNAFESLIMDVPIARNTLNDKINALGDPIVRDVDILVSQEKKDPVFKYLLDKKGWVAPVNKRTLIVFDFKTQQDRPVTDDEYYKFSKLRGSKIKEGISDIMKNGAMVKSGDTYIVKSAQELTSSELNKLLTPIKTKATKETKQELFSGAEGNF